MKQVRHTVLLLRLKTKDPEAFGQFYDAYVKPIYRFIYFKVSSEQEAEDLTAETFLKVWQHVQGNGKIDNLNAFTYRIARNLVIDHYRKQQTQKTVTSTEVLADQGIEIPDEQQSIADRLAVLSDVKQIEQHLQQMKDEYREIIILRYINQLTVKEIAEALDKKPGTVRVLAHRALNTLKTLVAEAEPSADA